MPPSSQEQCREMWSLARGNRLGFSPSPGQRTEFAGGSSSERCSETEARLDRGRAPLAVPDIARSVGRTVVARRLRRRMNRARASDRKRVRCAARPSRVAQRPRKTIREPSPRRKRCATRWIGWRGNWDAAMRGRLRSDCSVEAVKGVRKDSSFDGLRSAPQLQIQTPTAPSPARSPCPWLRSSASLPRRRRRSTQGGRRGRRGSRASRSCSPCRPNIAGRRSAIRVPIVRP